MSDDNSTFKLLQNGGYSFNLSNEAEVKDQIAEYIISLSKYTALEVKHLSLQPNNMQATSDRKHDIRC